MMFFRDSGYQFLNKGNRTPYLIVNGSHTFFPGCILTVANQVLRFCMNFFQFFCAGQGVVDNPLLHFLHSISGTFPFQSFGRLITFMTTRSGMPLWLREFFHMKKCRCMCYTDLMQT